MKFVFIICAILSTFSATPIKLCVDCKHFKSRFFTSNQFGKCTLFEIVKKDDYFLVDGVKRIKNDYKYCSTARLYEDMCGKDGKLYEKKEKNIFSG